MFADVLLPGLNATMNGLTALCLAGGFAAIRAGYQRLHRGLMLGAVGLSILFLVGYVTRLALTGTHRFPDVGMVKSIYLGILLVHSVLATVNLPLIIAALYFALRGRFTSHKKVVRFALPIWMVVSITGVVVYWMLYHLAPTLAGTAT